MSPLLPRSRGVVSACAIGVALLCAAVTLILLLLPAGRSDAGPRKRATLPIRPLRASIAGSSLSGLRPHWSRPRYVALIERAIAAGDRIAHLPYVYGGGHGGGFEAAGYDCSGSVSYVLHAMGLLSRPQDSGDLMSFGEPGPGEHVTIYSNPGHAYVVIDGRRFDTSGLEQTGTRWQTTPRSSAGYVVRHPAGL